MVKRVLLRKHQGMAKVWTDEGVAMASAAIAILVLCELSASTIDGAWLLRWSHVMLSTLNHYY